MEGNAINLDTIFDKKVYKASWTFTSHKPINSTSLRSSANCTTAATYYKKCSECGALLSSYYSSGSALGHANTTSYAYYNADYHTSYYCTRCGLRSGTGYHRPANANDWQYSNRYDYNADGSHCPETYPPYNGYTYYYSCASCGSGFTCYHQGFAYDGHDGFAYCSRCGLKLSFNTKGQS